MQTLRSQQPQDIHITVLDLPYTLLEDI
jgi:hypothetical protein